MKEKRGFTLVELLGVIAILGIVLVIAIPKISDVVYESKKKTFFADAKAIIRQLQYSNTEFTQEYLSNLDLGDMKLEEINLDASTAFKYDDTIYLNVVGKDKYKNMYLCNISSVTKEINVLETACNNLLVFFDANGGNVDTLSKEVTYNSNYGDLPTPTREGYTFKGWNGKNLIDDEKIRNYNNWKTDIVSNGSYPTNYGNPGFLLDLDAGKTYTISIDAAGTAADEIPPYFYLCKIMDDNGYLVSYLTTINIIKLNYTFQVNEGEVYFLRIGRSGNVSQFNSNIAMLTTIQLEENNTVTSYEPYYVTNSTIVTQNKNHTLTAIWEANS